MYTRSILVLFFSSICLVFLQEEITPNYGPYELVYEQYGVCQGPKSKNVTHLINTLDKETLVGAMNITFFEDTRIDEVRISVYNMKNNKKNLLWHYKMNQPCNHFSMSYILKFYYNTDTCVVKKGSYYNAINYMIETPKIVGTSFFYGLYHFKTVMSSKKGNIACVVCSINFKRKS